VPLPALQSHTPERRPRTPTGARVRRFRGCNYPRKVRSLTLAIERLQESLVSRARLRNLPRPRLLPHLDLRSRRPPRPLFSRCRHHRHQRCHQHPTDNPQLPLHRRHSPGEFPRHLCTAGLLIRSFSMATCSSSGVRASSPASENPPVDGPIGGGSTASVVGCGSSASRPAPAQTPSCAYDMQRNALTEHTTW